MTMHGRSDAARRPVAQVKVLAATRV